MAISVILCTHNRHDLLAKALQSISQSSMPNSIGWEVLIIDNNSTARTREVVEEFCRGHVGRFRYVFEPRQGLSHARNAGICQARGQILAFVDDDVTVESTWLQSLTASLHNGKWAGAGGRTVPVGMSSLPRWLSLHGPYSMGGVICAHFDLGDEPKKLDRPPYGTNMAFSKKVFEKYGSFRTDLGRSSDTLMGNEDTEFGRRLIAGGESLRYEPSAVVYHVVPESRLNQEYFLRWWFDFGRALVREWGRGPNFLGIPRPYLSILKILMTRMPRTAAQWMLALQPQQRFFFKAQLWRVAGEVAEFYSLARSRD